MPDQIYYHKIIDKNKLIFYSRRFKSFWEYIQVDGYSNVFALGCWGITVVGFTTAMLPAITLLKLTDIHIIIGFIFFPLIIFLYTLWGIIKAKNYFFELTISKKEIIFYSYQQQWTYKVADIKKIREKNRSTDDCYVPIFFIEIERQIKEIEPLSNWFMNRTYTFLIIKDLCQFTGIQLENEFGNLVEF